MIDIITQSDIEIITRSQLSKIRNKTISDFFNSNQKQLEKILTIFDRIDSGEGSFSVVFNQFFESRRGDFYPLLCLNLTNGKINTIIWTFKDRIDNLDIFEAIEFIVNHRELFRYD